MHKAGRENHSKSFSALAVLALCMVTASVVTIFPFKSEVEISSSRITFFNDLRGESLEFEIKLNDEIVFKNPENKNISSPFFFPSKNGRYILETKINSKIEKREFIIADNKPKFIYVGFKDKNSDYIHYYYRLRDSLIKKEAGNDTISRKELTSLAKKVGQSISFENIKSMGYNPNDVYFEIKILDRPYMLL